MRALVRPLVVGVALALLTQGLVAAPASAAQGDLEAGFGTAGVLPLEWSFGPVANTRALASGAGGTLLLAGDSGAIGCITRVTATGVLDTTYSPVGSAGYNATWDSPGYKCSMSGGVNGGVRAAQSTADGSLVGAMSTLDGRRVFKLGPAGATVFSTLLTPTFSGGNGVLDVTPLSDGRVAMLESRAADQTRHVVVLTAAGVFESAWVTPSPAGASFVPMQILPGPTGSIVLAGDATLMSDNVGMAARVSRAGVPDTAFGGDGFVEGSSSFAILGARAAVTPTGVVIAAVDTTDLEVRRFTSTGAPDTTFDSDGSVTFPLPASTVALANVLVRPDGRLYLSYAGGATARTVTVARLLSTGALDPAFGTAGVAVWDAGVGEVRVTNQSALGPLGDLYVHPEDPSDFDEVLRLDGTSDSAAPTAVAMTRPTSGWNLSSSVALAWTATDPSGVASTDVRTRRSTYGSGLAAYTAVVNATTTRTRTVTGVAGGSTLCSSVRSRDVWGLTSGWSSESCTSVPLTPSQLAKSGFVSKSSTGTYTGRVLRATATGSKVTRTGVRAKRISLVATTCATCGSVKVYFAGKKVRTISLKSSRTHKRVVLSVVTFGSLRSGTLTVRVASSGKKVLIEGIGVSSV